MKAKLFFAVFLLLFSVFTLPVSAHVLKTDGDIGAVLHVNPDDDPVVGEETNFFFEFKDRKNKFAPVNCNCIVSIADSGGKDVFTGNLFENDSNPSLESASFGFVFPKKDIYKITVSGAPKVEGQFQSFKLSYDLRVAKVSSQKNNAEETKPENDQNKLIYILVSAILVGGVYVWIKRSNSSDVGKS